MIMKQVIRWFTDTEIHENTTIFNVISNGKIVNTLHTKLFEESHQFRGIYNTKSMFKMLISLQNIDECMLKDFQSSLAS